ncbi:hypothetical protein SAMN06265365_11864 [Tistlia consotensis]|uniref:Transglycosylase SLT domain-containing protein n=1 Tax=Tistlia consotensis USBA 355 TaxID=560819 RepID=A0A1Y6CGE9_9PROT|nr:hypothetical protein [Tistlia consotensis]SMF53829.1 hypothetical protein SAMN05428998_11965 [Tistlia consotensis USBA 355]SNR86092.1 hypothetical protein SAMN06265365_11864 [Tistlia consotensis]
MPATTSRRTRSKSGRSRTLLAGAAGEPDRKTVLYPFEADPETVRDYWQSKGCGGPRPDLDRRTLRVLRDKVDRRPDILNDEAAVFPVDENPAADSELPNWRTQRRIGWDAVQNNASTIEAAARRYGVDPDLVKAIVYAENALGYYDVFAFGMQDTILPMNINPKMWKALADPGQDAWAPEDNIDMGVRLIKRLAERVPGGSAAQIATLYNSLSQEKVTDYGARVARIYRERPWEAPERKRPFKAPPIGGPER